MILTTTSDIIRIVTSTAANIGVQASWADITTSAFTPGRTNTLISSATTTTVVPSPAASTQKQVKTLTIFNTHASLANLVTVQLYDGSNSMTMYTRTLQAGESIQYDGCSWQALTSGGVLVTASAPSYVDIQEYVVGGTFTWTKPTNFVQLLMVSLGLKVTTF